MIYSKSGLLDDKFRPFDDEEQMTVAKQEREKNKAVRGGFKKPQDNYWLYIIPDKKYILLRRMNQSNFAITAWLKRLVQMLVVSIGMGILLGIYFNKLFFLFAIFAPVYLYMNKMRFVDTNYRQWQFERRLQFSKFMRLVIPYLKQTSTVVSMYKILGMVVKRLDNIEDRELLQRLRSDLLDRPNDLDVFEEYAQRAAGTSQSILFMDTLFDIHQGSTDRSIVDELGKMASEELLRNIDEIIKFKDRGFLYFPTKITLMSIVVVMGYTVSYLIYSISSLHLGSMGMK